MRHILGFFPFVSAIILMTSFVERESSSARLYTPPGSSEWCKSVRITNKRLSMDKNERAFSNDPKGQGTPLLTTLYKRFRFPLFPGPWIIQGRRIKSLFPSGSNLVCRYSSALRLD